MIHDIIHLLNDHMKNYGYLTVERFDLSMIKEVKDETTVFSTKDSCFHTTTCHCKSSDKILIVSWRSSDLQEITVDTIELLGVQYISKSEMRT